MKIKFDSIMRKGGILEKNGVYQILNETNGSWYVGSTQGSFAKRFLRHRNRLRMNKHANPHLQSSFNKYGENSFVFVIVMVIEDKNKIIEAEQKELDIHFGKPYCYNICKDAVAPMTDRKHTPETIAKMSAASKSRAKEIGECTRKRQLGTKHSAETIKKMSISAKARDDSKRVAVLQSQEFRDKVSKTTKGVKKSKKWHDSMEKVRSQPGYGEKMSLATKGIKKTDEWKAKASATRLGKQITFINSDGLIETPISLRKFSEKYNLDRHKIKALVGGLILEYKGWKIDKIVEL